MSMQKAWYFLMRAYVKLGLYFYFKKIILHGTENIPKKGAVLFCPNHQNAFMDALLVATHCRRSSHYLVRGDIFKKPWANWLLSSLNMIPIFRIRDGRSAMTGNDEVFDKCGNLLLNNETILIFPEGNHNIQRRLRSLSKGFTRLIFSALEKDPELDVQVVPVGINFTAHEEYGSKVSIYYGKPISSIEYYRRNVPLDLRDKLSEELKKLITHIESNYEETISRLEETNPNYLNPSECNARLEQLGDSPPSEIAFRKKPGLFGKVLSFPFYIINYLPLLVWQIIKRGVKDPAFFASLKYCVGITIFPLYYAGLAGLVYLLFSEPLFILGVFILLLISMPLMNCFRRIL